MASERIVGRELQPPPLARLTPESFEVLRVWTQAGISQQVALTTAWKDPGAWGLMLVDIARHAAKAYEREGFTAKEVLQRIRELFDAEWDSPTDEPLDLTNVS